MAKNELDKVITQWARVGVLFGHKPDRRTPDLEHLLLNTARHAPGSARLFYLSVTWLSQYGNFIARHRLKHLAETNLAIEYQPTLGALLALAVKHGASKELLIAAEACHQANTPHPLFEVQQRSKTLTEIARKQASPEGLKWNLWVPDQPTKLDALRPANWIIKHNPVFLSRVIRKGDLRCSILQVLEHDTTDGTAESEVSLAHLCSANRLAIRHALDDLELEGYAKREKANGSRNIQIKLTTPASSLSRS